MTNKSKSYLLLVPLLMATAGCTHMDGDIGSLFGRWRLDTLTADGVALPLYDSAGDDVLLYAWSFQGPLVWVQTVRAHNDYRNDKGMWTRTDSQLLLDFSHSDDEGTDYYRPPSILHLVDGGVTPLNIASESSSEMSLWYVSEVDGVKYEYHLTKAY